MRIDGTIPYSWDKVNEAIKSMLQADCQVQAYKSTSHALFEVCLGLHLRFSHKRRILARFGFGSHSRNIELEMAKMGVRFKSDLGDEGDKELKQTLAFVHDFDDALTAEIFDHSGLSSRLNEQNIFQIHVLHHSFYHLPNLLESIGPFDIYICSLTKDMCITLLGEKCSLPSLSSAELYWGQYHIERARSCIHARYPADKAKVLKIEENLPTAASPWFPADFTARIFDRALFYFNEFDGGAFIDLFSEMYGLEPTVPGGFCQLEAASFSRWQNRIWLDQAEKLNRQPEQIRGLVSVAAEFIDDGFKAKMIETLKALKNLSH